MADFQCLVTWNPSGSGDLDDYGNIFGTWVYGAYTTDNNAPIVQNGVPQNFSVAGCTDFCAVAQILENNAVGESGGAINLYGNTTRNWLIGATNPSTPSDNLAFGLSNTFFNVYYAGGASYNLGETNYYGLNNFGNFISRYQCYLVLRNYEDGSRQLYVVRIDSSNDSADILTVGYDVTISPITPLPDYGEESEPSDDNGDYDSTSDTIETPTHTIVTDDGTVTTSTPVVSMANLGMITMWKVTQQIINNLGAQLWSSNFFSTIVKSFYAPIDAVISLNIVPSINDVLTYGTGNILLGNYDTGITASKLASQFYEVDMGSYTFSEYWGSALDYNPYTDIQLYMPYIGTVSLSPDVVMGKTISVKYKIDVVTGQLSAYLYVNGSIISTFTGNCSVNIPITGANYSGVYKGIIQGTVGLATGIAGAAAVGGTIAGGGSGSLAFNSGMVTGAATDAVNGSKIQYQNGSPMSLTSGFLSPQFCYVIITRPNQSLASGYKSFVGYPSNITATLGSLTGFTSVESVHLEGINATSEELEEIESLLKNGVIIQSNGTTPSATGMNVQLYLNSSETNVIGKNLSAVGNTRACKLKEATSIIHPTIIVNDTIANLSGGNYMYIPAFNRFYYVTDMVQNQGMTEIQLRCDVLESHRAGILACTAVISRQENSFNRKLNDPLFKTYQNSAVVTKKLSGNGFGQAGYILVTAGGAS